MRSLLLTLLLVVPIRTAAASHVEEVRIPSTIYVNARRAWVITPPGYDAKGPECSFVLAFDGTMYLDDMPMAAALDQLQAEKKIGPTIALLIDDFSGAERSAELANRAQFLKFLTTDVLPWLHARYRVTQDPHKAIITGASAGGLAAAYVAFNRPDLFGSVFSQSGAFWRGNEASNGAPFEWLTSRIEASPKRDVRFVLDAGSTENHGAMGGAAPSILEANRHLRDVLLKKGYDVKYYEVPDGQHLPDWWRKRLVDGLAAASSSARP